MSHGESEYKPTINIALSGWAGVGTSTLSLLMADTLDRPYIYLGSVFRELGQRMGSVKPGSTEQDLLSQEAMIQPAIGKTMDEYVRHSLIHKRGVVLESDLSAFLIDNESHVFSVFLTSGFEKRAERVQIDARDGGVEALHARDEILRQEYLNLWNVDIFDEQLISQHFRLIVDTTDLSMVDEFQAVLDDLQVFAPEEWDWTRIPPQARESLLRWDQGGKEALRNSLREKQLFVEAAQIMREIIEIFPERVAQFPDDVREHFG